MKARTSGQKEVGAMSWKRRTDLHGHGLREREREMNEQREEESMRY